MDILTRSPYYLTVTGSGEYDTKEVEVYEGDIQEVTLELSEVDDSLIYNDPNIDDVATNWVAVDANVAQGNGTCTLTSTDIFNPITLDPAPRLTQSGSIAGGEKYEVVLRIASEVDFLINVKSGGSSIASQAYTALGEGNYQTVVLPIDRTGSPSVSAVLEVILQNSQIGDAAQISYFGVNRLLISSKQILKDAPVLRFEFNSSSTGQYTFDLGTVLNDYVDSRYRVDGTQKFTLREYLLSSSVEVNVVSQSVFGYDGYGYFNEGENPSITDRVLLSTNRIYTPSGSDVVIPVKSDQGNTIGLVKDFNKVVSTTSTTSSIEYQAIDSGSIESSNLLTSPKDLIDSAWNADFVTVTGGQNGPDGSTDAFTITKDPNSANDRIWQHVIDILPGNYTMVVYVKDVDMEEGGRSTMGIKNFDGSTRLFRKGIEWNSGVPSFTTAYATGTPVSESIEEIGDGWYKIALTCNLSDSAIRWEYDVDRRFGTTSTGGVTLFEPMFLEGTDSFQTTFFGEDEEIEGRKRYTLECGQEDPIKVTFINKYGAFEDIYFTGNSSETLNIEREELQNMTVHNTGRHIRRNTMLNGFKSMTINSGFYPEDYNEAFKQLLQSERVWMDYKGEVLPVTVTDSSFNMKTSYTDKLINYTLQVERAFNEISKLR